MAKSRPKKYFIIGAVILIMCLFLFFGGRYFAFHKIRNLITIQADSLRSIGYEVHFDSLETSAAENRISVKNLLIKFPVGSSICKDTSSSISLKKVDINGLELLAFILHKKIRLKSINIQSPWFKYAKSKKVEKTKKVAKTKLESIHLDQLTMHAIRFDHYDTSTCTISMSASTDFEMNDLFIQDPQEESINTTFAHILMRNTSVKLHKKLYTITLKKAEWKTSDKSVDIDSLLIKPDYSKEEYAQKIGVQIDRIDCSIPTIHVEGLDAIVSKHSSIHANNVKLGFIMEIFHDKRYPGAAPHYKKLPSRALADINLPITIDSVSVTESSLTYQEFPVGGDRAGEIEFKKLHASVHNISNHAKEPMTMYAYTRFMDAGDLNARFTFPVDPAKDYSIHATLKNMDMREINKMLIPIARAEIKKGQLHEMRFDYNYNEYRSDGTLTMHYTDLDLVTLQKNKEPNKFLTTILNVFILKKDMDKNKSEGKILFYRDPHKSTFNYWWKSILSGIKSVYNLDKIMDTHHSKKASR